MVNIVANNDKAKDKMINPQYLRAIFTILITAFNVYSSLLPYVKDQMLCHLSRFPRWRGANGLKFNGIVIAWQSLYQFLFAYAN